MGTNMQNNNSYFPGYYYTADLDSGASCSAPSLHINDQILKDSPFSCNFSIPPTADEHLAYNKEIIKQTMLKQESIFRDQLHELHRLYRRQGELMHERKRIELHTDVMGSGISQSDTVMSQMFSCQKENHVQSLNSPKPASQYNTISGSEVPSTFSFNEVSQSLGGAHPLSTLKYSDAPVSKCKKIGKKLLDLELPADEYIDSDEGESVEVVKILKAPRTPSYPVTIANNGDVSLTTSSMGFNSVSKGDSLLPKSSSRKRNWITDLNEPIKVDEEVHLAADEFVGIGTSQREILSENMPEKEESFCQAISEEVIVDKKGKQRKIGRDLNYSPSCLSAEELRMDSKSSEMEVKQARDSPTSYLLDKSSNKSEGSNGDISNIRHTELIDNLSIRTAGERVPQSDAATSSGTLPRRVIVQALPSLANSAFFIKNSRSCIKRCGTAGDKCQHSESVKRSKLDGAYWQKNQSEPSTSSDNLNCNTDREVLVEIGSQAHANFDDSRNSSSESKDTENCSKYGIPDMNLACRETSNAGKQPRGTDLVVDNEVNTKVSHRYQFDLNKCMNEDESCPLPAFPKEMDIKWPISPENKEGSPTRGESDETQLEAGPEDTDVQEAQVRMAAEAIVSISSPSVLSRQERETCNPSEGLENDSLHWFSKIVSSVTGGLDNKLLLLRGKAGAEYENFFLSEAIDYFEVMTLKLADVKVEKYLTKTIYQNEVEVGATQFLSQPWKGRTRRGTRRGKLLKKFQDEILPGLSTLSGYEVSDDLQTIGEIMQITGTRRRTNSPTNADRLEWGKGSRRSCEKTMQREVKHKQSNTVPNLEEGSVLCWGKITKRRRGRRTPISNL